MRTCFNSIRVTGVFAVYRRLLDRLDHRHAVDDPAEGGVLAVERAGRPR